MIRGGDTPTQETLWAIEFESGKFAFGHANENKIFVATSGIGRQIWYADGNGFIAGSAESVDEITDTLIKTYNEHFGTRISNLTPEAKTFNVGDIIKNWNAYEKIELLKDKIKLKMTNNMWSFASIRNNTVLVAASDEHSFFVVNDNGEISQIIGGIENLIERNWVPKLSEAGFNFEVSQEIVDFQIGQSVDNWNRFISI